LGLDLQDHQTPIAPGLWKAYTIYQRPNANRPTRREIMARLTKPEKFQAKIGIEMDHLKAGLTELRAKAKEVKLEARTEFDKSLDALEKLQADVKNRLEEWAKAGQGAGKELKKGIKQSTKDLKKSVKKAYKNLT